MTITHVARHSILTMTALNTFKVSKKDLSLPANTKAAVIEDIIMEIGVPDIVASTTTVTQGALAIGNQEASMANCSIGNAGTIIKDKCVIVADATPLPVVYDSSDPLMREGPFPLIKDADGQWYVTLGITSVACTNLKEVSVRLDLTIEV